MGEVQYGLAGVVADDTRISEVISDLSMLSYRGYPVHELADRCRFEETAFLILKGELPDQAELQEFRRLEKESRGVPDELLSLIRNLPRPSHPMDTLRTCVSWLGQRDREAGEDSPDALMRMAIRLLARIPEIVAADCRLLSGQEIVPPDPDLDYVGNFFRMCLGTVPDPAVQRCFDVSMTLYAEHSFNASTFTARAIISSLSDLYSAVTGAIGSLKGPLHGGANEAVMDTLDEIGSPENARDWLNRALAEKRKIMGFGHRVYRKGDSRVPTMKRAYRTMVEHVATDRASNLWAISEILEETMVAQKGIHPNLDFPAGPAYHLMGFPTQVFTPLFVMARITGWSAHIIEQLANNRLVRPLSNYTGPGRREVPPLGER